MGFAGSSLSQKRHQVCADGVFAITGGCLRYDISFLSVKKSPDIEKNFIHQPLSGFDRCPGDVRRDQKPSAVQKA
jgi:hypothetical protein